MARKKDSTPKKSAYKHEAYIEGSGSVVNESISDTLKKKYMPYLKMIYQIHIMSKEIKL